MAPDCRACRLRDAHQRVRLAREALRLRPDDALAEVRLESALVALERLDARELTRELVLA